MRILVLIAVAAAVLAAIEMPSAQQPDPAARLAAAQSRLAVLQQRSSRIDDINAIENLHRSYGFYTDKMLWDHVIDLFTEDGTIEIGRSGVYAGKASIRRYLYSLSDGQQGPLAGELYEHLQFQPVITLSEDGLSAKGRWRTLLQTGTSGSGSGGNWGEGPYENEYIKEGGIWKISKLHWYATFIAPYEGGWLNVSEDAVREYSVGRGVTPDRPPSVEYKTYPGVHIPPFHYANPVSGKAWAAGNEN